MNAAEIRDELLSQHANLRQIIDELHRSAGVGVPVAGTDGEVAAHVVRLARALREHNRREETLLRGVLGSVDAWGPVREEIMNEEHAAEHEELGAALWSATVGPESGMTGGALVDLLERVLEHMAREERVFLSSDVLKEDAILGDQCSG
jgi:hypothetical protein